MVLLSSKSTRPAAVTGVAFRKNKDSVVNQTGTHTKRSDGESVGVRSIRLRRYVVYVVLIFRPYRYAVCGPVCESTEVAISNDWSKTPKIGSSLSTNQVESFE